MKRALIFGATGFVGSYLLDELLQDPEYSGITAVVRRDPKIRHPKLKIVFGDYQTLSDRKDRLLGDDLFIAIGTTKKKVPDTKEYYQIDHDLPILAAKLAKENGVTSVFLVSSVGANANSNFFYLKTKGETERDLEAIGFAHTHIFRPSMLLGSRQEARPLERFFLKLWPLVETLQIGPFEKYRGVAGIDLARAIHRAAKTPAGKLTVYSWREMQGLLSPRSPQ